MKALHGIHRSRLILRLVYVWLGAYTEVTLPFVQRRPVHGTGLEASPQGLEVVPVGVLGVGGVARVGVV